VRRLAVLSFHTSPLAQPGWGDGGGMNVYVRELCTALAGAGIDCDVYTRSWHEALPRTVRVTPGFRVHHVDAGPHHILPKDDLPDLVDTFTAAVLDAVAGDGRPDVIHANYWLSGMAGHTMKHELNLPLVSTFHTLARVKADAAEEEPDRRARRESEIVGCSDAILASGPEEREQLERLYDAVPDRIEIVPPGVDPRCFSPGDKREARRALGLGEEPVLLFVGRIQPLKGLDVAVGALAELDDTTARLVVVGGPSGPSGERELARVHAMVDAAGLAHRVRFVAPQPHDRLAAFYRAADVCLVPSRSESFGLVALEAAACATPVVAAGVGGLCTVVADGETGYLVDGRDPAAYATRVAKIIGDADLGAAMGARGLARSVRYRWSIAAARLRRLYADLTARQPVDCT